MRLRPCSLRFMVGSLVLVAILFTSGYAAATQLVVVPTRVVLEGRESQDFQVVHGEDQSVDYRVSVLHYSQQPDGKVKKTERISKRQLLAQKMIRFSPRKSTLGPGDLQLVRVVARPLPNLPDGEYRVHLHFAPLAGEKAPRPKSSSRPGESSINIRLMVAVAIPVLYRHGQTHLEMAIDRFEIVAPAAKHSGKQVPAGAKVQLSRKGTRSAFGDVLVFHKAPGAAEWAAIGKLGGVPIYIPTPTVTRVMRLDLPPGVAATSLKGQIKVQFRDREQGGKKEILAEKVFTL